MKNKILIFSSVLFLGVVASYVAFGWSERTSTMPGEYKIPINTSIESQDVTAGKPVIVNLNSDQVDGYNASDLLAATSSSSSCPDNYANLCSEGGGLAFTYGGKTLYIDAFPRSSAWYSGGSPTGQSLAWQMCADIGARLPTLAEWQAACTALGGPTGNGRTTFGGMNNASRWEWVADPSSATASHAVLAGGGSCSGTSAGDVGDGGSGNDDWFRCVR